MAYNTDELEKKALAAIKRHNLVFIEDVVAYLPCDKTTFYRHECHECNAIKDALAENRVKTKVALRKKWKDSDNATLQVALYKLISEEDEFKRLTGQSVDHTSKGDKVDFTPLYFGSNED